MHISVQTGVLLLTCFIISNNSLYSQVKPSATELKAPNAANGNLVPNKPGAYGSNMVANYVKTYQPQRPISSEVSVISSTDVGIVHKATQYFDGLGRAIQTVNWQISPSKLDMVQSNVYDVFGREEYKFLPYTSPSNTGNFKSDPFNEQASFYSGTYTTEQPAFNNEKFYYSHAVYEASPLNRPSKSFSPGNSWAGSEGSSSEKMVQIQYLLSGTNEVKTWDIGYTAIDYSSTNENSSINIPAATGFYTVGTLNKSVSKDEQGNVVVEYKNMDGKVILKKVQVGAVASDYSGYAGFLSTYYIYDDLDRLRFVIPPKATAYLVAPHTAGCGYHFRRKHTGYYHHC